MLLKNTVGISIVLPRPFYISLSFIVIIFHSFYLQFFFLLLFHLLSFTFHVPRYFTLFISYEFWFWTTNKYYFNEIVITISIICICKQCRCFLFLSLLVCVRSISILLWNKFITEWRAKKKNEKKTKNCYLIYDGDGC